MVWALFGIVFSALILLALSIYEFYKNHGFTKISFVFIFLILIQSVMGIALQISTGYYEDKMQNLTSENVRLSTELNEFNKYYSNSGKFDFVNSLNYSSDIIIDYGTNKMYLDSVSDVISTERLIYVQGLPSITVAREGNHLFVNATIFNQEGKIVLQITDNNWEINPWAGAWRKNFDSSGFEVIDVYGNPIFQLDIINNTIFLKGIFCSKYGRTCFIADEDGLTINPYTFDFFINPLFRYPTLGYRGVRS